MNHLQVNALVENERKDHVADEDQLLENLRALWVPHRDGGLRVRYEMGQLLNKKLGDPCNRQKHGRGTIARVSAELEIDKSDISRIRRFAAMFESFKTFRSKQPSMTSWTKVRSELLAKKPSRDATDNRDLWHLLRSVKTSAASLERIERFDGPKADDLRTALVALFRVAQAKLDIRFDGLTGDQQQTDLDAAAA